MLIFNLNFTFSLNNHLNDFTGIYYSNVPCTFDGIFSASFGLGRRMSSKGLDFFPELSFIRFDSHFLTTSHPEIKKLYPLKLKRVNRQNISAGWLFFIEIFKTLFVEKTL